MKGLTANKRADCRETKQGQSSSVTLVPGQTVTMHKTPSKDDGGSGAGCDETRQLDRDLEPLRPVVTHFCCFRSKFT